MSFHVKNDRVKIEGLDCFAVKGGKQILSNVSLTANPGEVVAIMGPSGSGKTTMLNFIGNRRLSGLNFKCGLFTHGPNIVNASFWKQVKFVEQEDHLHGFMTVRSLLDQYITLNYGFSVDRELRDDLITEILSMTGLKDQENVRIGDVFRKGISGGQKRRLSVAAELVARPKILVLDEPTSGLDSGSAFHIINQLRQIAREMNAVIIMSIHQPSSEIWVKLDRLLLLSKGQVMYDGDIDNVIPAFAYAGDQCPDNYNPADFIISLVNNDFNPDIDLNKYAMKFVEWRKENPDYVKMERGGSVSGSGVRELNKRLKELESKSANGLTHFFSLLWRNLKNSMFNPGVFGVRFFMYTMLAFLCAIVFHDLHDEKGFAGVTGRAALFFYAVAFFIFMSIAAMPFFLMERAIFEKEYGNNLFGITSYVFSQTTATIPGVFLISLLSSGIIVGICGLRHFDIFLLDMFLSLLVAEQIALCMAVIVPHYIIGMAMIAGLYGFFMLVQGFMKIYEKMPASLQWTYYIAVHSYSFRVFMRNEFHDIHGLNTTQWDNGHEVLEFYDMAGVDISLSLSYIAYYYLIVFAMTLGVMLFKYRRTTPKLEQGAGSSVNPGHKSLDNVN